MSEKQKILIVDDDENISELVSLYLKKECFGTKCVGDGTQALDALLSYKPDLILLDIMLPGEDGYEILRRIRKHNNVPVIMLSAKGETFDKVLSLELGADDYIMKPFDSKEMVSRVKAVLRRYSADSSTQPSTANQSQKIVSFPDLTINLSEYTVLCRSQYIKMPQKELELLYFLASHPNQVFTREQLLDYIWGYEYFGDTRTVDVHVKRIREKIKKHTEWNISTVWGIGYKFEHHRKE